MDWSFYDRGLAVHGETAKDRAVSLGRRTLESKYPASLSFKEVKIGGIDGDTDGEEARLLVTSTQNRYAKTINALPGDDFNVGSIVYWNRARWLITQKDVEDEMNKKGGMELCNRKLRWQNPDTLEIHERWITINKPYSSNLQDLRQLEVSSREFKIQISHDEETEKFDIGKRFLMEKIGGAPKSYCISSIDCNTERYAVDGGVKGFLIINIEQDQWNPNTDNESLMIADYKPPIPPLPPPDELYIKFVYAGKAEIKQGNSVYKKFAALVTDGNGEPVLGAVTVLTADIEPENIPLIDVETEPGKIRLKALAAAPIGAVALINALYSDGTVTVAGDLPVKVVGIY
jgi:hypothetical protein